MAKATKDSCIGNSFVIKRTSSYASSLLPIVFAVFSIIQSAKVQYLHASMRSRFSILLTAMLVCCALFAFAQKDSGAHYALNWDVVHKIDSIKITLCNNDTAATIRKLAAIEKSYPDDVHIVFSDKVLGDLYLAKGETDSAIHCFLHALSVPFDRPYTFRRDTPCDSVYSSFVDPYTCKAAICIAISKVYLLKNKPDSSIYYLQFADDKYLPYKDCGNGINMYRTYLSLFFADAYLANGDTTKAINRLLDYFMNRDGNTVPVTAKLKMILLHHYTLRQIRSNIKKGRARATIMPHKNVWYNSAARLVLFDHEIFMNSGRLSQRKWKRSITRDKSIRQLIAREPAGKAG